MFKMILAAGANDELGKDNKLLWNLPDDLAYFKKQTEGKCVLMGRKTYESLPFKKGLPNRKNLVISSVHKQGYISDDVVWFTSISQVLQIYQTSVLPFEDIWVIGGARIYGQFKDKVEEVHLTRVNQSFDADTFFDTSWLKDRNTWELDDVRVLSEEASVYVYKKIK